MVDHNGASQTSFTITCILQPAGVLSDTPLWSSKHLTLCLILPFLKDASQLMNLEDKKTAAHRFRAGQSSMCSELS